MAFGSFDPEGRGEPRTAPLADINMTPLIDVMLVLLVIFIISAPLFSRSIALDLPKEKAAAAAAAAAPPIAIAIDRHGQLFWNGRPIADTELAVRFEQAAAANPQPEVALSADQATAYRRIAAVMAAAQQAGMQRFGFVVAR